MNQVDLEFMILLLHPSKREDYRHGPHVSVFRFMVWFYSSVQMINFSISFSFFKLFIYSYSVIYPPCSPPLPSPLSPSQFRADPILPLSLILLKKRHKSNKEEKAFLLVELRIAIQKYS
jgi:hypothetical protein